MNKLIGWILSAVVALGGGLALSACGVSGAVGSASGSGSCGSTPASRRAPVVVVLPGATRTDASASLAASRQTSLVPVITGSESMGARLVVVPLGSSLAGSSVSVDLAADPSGPNPLFTKTDRSCVAKEVGRAITGASSHPQPGEPDVLGSLSAIAGEVHGLSSSMRVDVVVMSSMLGRLDGVELSGLTTSEVPGLVRAVKGSGSLTDCDNWDFYIVGAGESASGPVNDETSLALRQLWSELIGSCGGEIMAWTATLERFPVTSVLPPPKLSKSTVSISLPASLLFPSGSASLLPSSHAALGELASLLEKTYPKGPVTVAGYCDNEATSFPGGNEGLSLARASSVAAALFRAGVAGSRLRTVGFGASRFVASNATVAGRQANRRVVVIVQLT